MGKLDLLCHRLRELKPRRLAGHGARESGIGKEFGKSASKEVSRIAYQSLSCLVPEWGVMILYVLQVSCDMIFTDKPQIRFSDLESDALQRIKQQMI
jgi:hypothetical protein